MAKIITQYRLEYRVIRRGHITAQKPYIQDCLKAIAEQLNRDYRTLTINEAMELGFVIKPVRVENF